MSLPPWRASKRWWHGYSNTHKVQGCIGEGDRQSMCLCLLGWDPYSRVRRFYCCSHCYLQVTVYPLCIFLLSFLLKSILLRRFSTACLGVQLEGRLVRLAFHQLNFPYLHWILFISLTDKDLLSIHSVHSAFEGHVLLLELLPRCDRNCRLKTSVRMDKSDASDRSDAWPVG